MYCREKPYRQENYKSRKTHRSTPSFSSTLLDEIYHSMDGNADQARDFKAHREAAVTRQSGFRTQSSSIGDDPVASLTRACLVDKWMEKEVNEKVAVVRRRQAQFPAADWENPSFQDNDLVFFSSTSTSSDSSGALSSSDTEFFGSTTTTKSNEVSCFSARPKPVRTHVTNPLEKCFLFEDYQINQHSNITEDELMKSKSKALRIYANLKKVKQPISPGGRLTSFITSLFANAHGKKKSKNHNADKGFQDLESPKAAAPSSASSFSRSCLTKYSPKSTDKARDATKRTVRFHPVSVIVDQDSKPCGQKSLYNEGYSDRRGRPPLPPKELTEPRSSRRESNRKAEEAVENASKGHYSHSQRKNDYSISRKVHHQEDDDEDAVSDSSSDLFELDHLAMFGNGRFCKELPVYETTYFDKNRGLIR